MWALFALVMGLVVTMIGVGAIESSVTSMELFYGVVWALNGLVFMWLGVSMIKGEVDE